MQIKTATIKTFTLFIDEISLFYWKWLVVMWVLVREEKSWESETGLRQSETESESEEMIGAAMTRNADITGAMLTLICDG